MTLKTGIDRVEYSFHLFKGWTQLALHWQAATIMVPMQTILQRKGTVMSKNIVTRGAVIVFILVLVVLVFRAVVKPVIAAPFEVEPITRYGIDVERVGVFGRYEASRQARHHDGTLHNHVYILGVFRGGNVFHGEEVTHMINAEELVAILAETIMVRSFPIFRNRSIDDSDWRWSINLHQNRDIHIILRGGNGEMVAMGRNSRSYIVFNVDAIEAALERMVMEYNDGKYMQQHTDTLDSAYAVMRLVQAFIYQNPDCPVTLNMDGVAWKGNNEVIIRMVEHNEEQIVLFRETIIDSPFLVFEQSLGPDMPAE